MTEYFPKLSARLLAAAALSLAAACTVSAGGQIPCADDASCPADYPVCSPPPSGSPGAKGKCVAGTSTSAVSVAIVGVLGHAPGDILAGKVTVAVSARAKTGIPAGAVTLTGGSQTYQPNASSVPPLYYFDVATSELSSTTSDATLIAKVTAGDGTTASSAGLTIHIDNQVPTLTSARVGSADIADGSMVKFDVTTSEPVSSITGTVAGPGSTSLSEISAATGLVHHFGYAVTAADAEGPHDVTFITTNLAGTAGSLTASAAFNVRHPFVFGSLVATTPVGPVGGVPGAKLGTVVTITGTLPNRVTFGSGATPVFTLTSASGGTARTLTPAKTAGSPNDTWTATYIVVAADHDGFASVTADASDLAGNVAPSRITYVLIDQTLPALVAISSNKTFVFNPGSLTISGVASKPLKSATVSVDSGDIGTCTCDGGPCATDPSATPTVSCSVSVTNGGTSTPTPVTATVVLLDLVGNQSAAIAANQIGYTVEPQIALTGQTFGVTFSQSSNNLMTGGSSSGFLSFKIPTIKGASTASLVDSLGNSYFTSSALLAASGSTINATSPARPMTLATDSSAIPFTLVVASAAGTSLTRTTTLIVVPKPVITSFKAAASTVTNTNSTTLTAIFAGGTGAVSKDAFATPTPITNGLPLLVTPASNATTTYQLRVTNLAGDTEGIVTFGTSVPVLAIQAATMTGAFNVTYNGTGISSMTGGSNTGNLTFAIPLLAPTLNSTASITDNIGNTYGTSSAILNASNNNLIGLSLPVTAPTDSRNITFTLTLTNAAGTSATPKTTTLTVVPKPVISSFTAAATTVTNANTTTLTAIFTGGTGVVSTDDFVSSTPIVSNVPLTVTPLSSVTTTWKLRVSNALADTAGIVTFPTTVSVQAVARASATGQVSVTPHLVSFSGTGNLTFTAPTFGPTVVPPGTISGGGGSVSIASGGTAQLPVPTATTTYTLTLTNGAGGNLTQTVTVLVASLLGTPPLPTVTCPGAVRCIGNFGVSATWLGAGSTRVLLAGGSSAANCSGTIANGWVLWDTATASNVSFGGFAKVTTGRCGHTATLLPNGKVVIAGGAASTDANAKHLDVFDPGLGSMGDDVSLLSTARCGLSAALAAPAANKIVFGGGSDCTAYPGGAGLATVEVYDYADGVATTMTSVLAPLNANRVGGTATLLANGNVLFAGGNTATADVFTLNATYANSTIGPSATVMRLSRTNHTATLLQSGKVLLVGGVAGTLTAVVDIYDPAASALGSFAPSTPLSAGRAFHGAALLPSGLVLVAGGLVNATVVATGEFYDPGTNTFVSGGSTFVLSSARQQFSLVNLGDLNFAFGGNAIPDTDEFATP